MNNLRVLVYVTGVAALLFSLGDLFAAAPLAGMVGGQLDKFGVAFVQIRGAVGLLYVYLAYFARYADDNALRRVVGPTMLWGFIAQFLVILYVLLTGVFNTSGYIFIVLGAIFISAYFYLLYMRRE